MSNYIPLSYDTGMFGNFCCSWRLDELGIGTVSTVMHECAALPSRDLGVWETNEQTNQHISNRQVDLFL